MAHTPGYNTGGAQPGNLYKFPSMTSMHSVISMGYLPPGHGYVPKKQKPDKPYGLPFTTRLNRTARGPGSKYLKYALVAGLVGLFFFMGAALYFGHRNVSRMIVMRTEILGAIMVIIGIVCVAIMGEYIYKARIESNRWREGIRFKPEGLNTAAAVHKTYVPESVTGEKLLTGTFGPKALKEIPKPRPKKKKGRSKAGSKQNLAVLQEVEPAPPGHQYQQRAQLPPQGPAPPRYDMGPSSTHFQPIPSVHQSSTGYGPRPPYSPTSPGPGYAPYGSNNPAFRMEDVGERRYDPAIRVAGLPTGPVAESDL